jgi:hypothetical protein
LGTPSGKITCGKKEPIFGLGCSPSCTIGMSVSSAGRRAERASIELQVSPAADARAGPGYASELRDPRAFAKLPEEQRSAILLVGLEGMRYDEAASVANVRSELSARELRAAAKLARPHGLFPGGIPSPSTAASPD